MDSPDPLTGHVVVLFDGVCNLCNGFVQFLIRRDPKGIFKFASLQSDYGRQQLIHHHLDPDALHSVIVIDKGKLYDRSDAVFRIVGLLPGLWPLLGVFRIFPRFITDGLYNWMAGARYRWFGRRDSCMVPDPALKSRFLG
ncbi:MAG: thiol-disulfide oxidoreductase DCC family protein [Chryseolinea sp.]